MSPRARGPIIHGSPAGYRTHRCRCDECRSGQARRVRAAKDRRRNRPADVPEPAARPGAGAGTEWWQAFDEQGLWRRPWVAAVLGRSRVTVEDIVDLDLGVSPSIIAADRGLSTEHVRSVWRRVRRAADPGDPPD